MPEKILILGANSFYGSNFARLVEERGDVAIRMGRKEFDIEDSFISVINAATGKGAADYIVNFISRSLVAESWEDPCAWVETNATATTRLIDVLRRYWEGRKVIHVSTPEVYGSTPSWVDEDAPYNPTTPYAVSRAAGDMMLKAYHKAYGFPAIITRTANIYGPGQQDYRIISKALACKKDRTKLQLHGKGESVRSFIHIKDACEATYLICKQGRTGETYHISTPKAHSIREVVEMIGCEYECVPDRLGKDQAYLLNSRKVRNLGWKDTFSLEEGLCELSR